MAESLQQNSDVATDWGTLRFVIEQLLSRVATCTLVKVVACTNSGGISSVGTVDVQPVIKMVAADGSTWEHGRLYKLPYMRMQGGANAVILDPVAGDLGLAVFASRDISAAKSTAGAAELRGSANGIDPGSARQFDMSDGVYIGGLLNATPTQFVRFASGGVTVLSPTKVTIEAPTIELKGDVVQTGGDITASGSITATGDVVGEGISLHDHIHGGVTPGGGSTAPPTP